MLRQGIQRTAKVTWLRKLRNLQTIATKIDHGPIEEIKAELNPFNIKRVPPNNKKNTVLPVTLFNKIAAMENLKLQDPNKTFVDRKITLKKMSDSYIETYLPFKSNPNLLHEYVNAYGQFRLGKLMEDLDILAANISIKHMFDGQEGLDTRPITIATASVDRMDLFLPKALEDFKLSGHVTYVGHSSMEVFIKVETTTDYPSPQENAPKFPEDISKVTPNTILNGRFTMVARDTITNKAAQVNPLILENKSQKRLFQIGEELKTYKRQRSEMALSRLPPTVEEREIAHDLYLEYSKYDDSQNYISLPPSMIWMQDTKVSSVLLMQPQDRNVQNSIFGGYLMRCAYELAFANALIFLGSPLAPKLLALDGISFRKPVPIGCILSLESQVVYAEGEPHKSFQINVKADVVDPVNGRRENTNLFQFTMSAQEEDPIQVRRVLPRTYGETMTWLEGKRTRAVGRHARTIIIKDIAKE